MEELDGVTPEEFANKIKEKYPQYKDVENSLLVSKMLEKYPQYKDKINFGDTSKPTEKPKKETADMESASTSATGVSSAESNVAEKMSLEDLQSSIGLQDEDVPEQVSDKRQVDLGAWGGDDSATPTMLDKAGKALIERSEEQKSFDVEDPITGKRYKNTPQGGRVEVEETFLSPATDKELELGRKFKSGVYTTGERLARFPQFATEQLFLASAPESVIKEANSIKDVNQREDFVSNYIAQNGAFGIGGSGSNAFQKLSRDKANEFAKEAEKLAGYFEQYETSIGEDIANFNFAQAGERTFNEVVASVPSMVVSMAPYGLLATASGSASQKSRERQEMGDDLGLNTSINAAVTGSSEALLEIFTKKLGGRFFSSLQKTGSDEAAKTAIQSFVSAGKDALGEGLTEAAQEAVSDLSDAYISGDEKAFENAFNRYIDSFIVGAGAGGATGAITEVTNKTKELATDIRINNIVESKDNDYNSPSEIFMDAKYMDKLDTQQIDVVGMPFAYSTIESDIKNKLEEGKIDENTAELIRENFGRINNSVKKVGNLKVDKETKTELVNLVNKKDILESEIKEMDKTVAEASGKVSEVNSINEQITNLINNKKNDVLKEEKISKGEETNDVKEEGNDVQEELQEEGNVPQETITENDSLVSPEQTKTKEPLPEDVKGVWQRKGSDGGDVRVPIIDDSVGYSATNPEINNTFEKASSASKAIIEVNKGNDPNSAISLGVDSFKKSAYYQSLDPETQKGTLKQVEESYADTYGVDEKNVEDYKDTVKAKLDKFTDVAMEKLTVNFQDKFYPIRKGLNKLRSFYEGSDSFSNAEIAMSGKTAQDRVVLDKKKDKLASDLKNASKRLKKMGQGDLRIADIDRYMISKHAEERNVEMRRRAKESGKPASTDFASGYNPDEIVKLTEGFSPEKIKELEALSEQVYDILKDSRNMMLKFGLISQDTYNKLDTQYKYYVPLTGFADPTIESKEVNPRGNLSTSKRTFFGADGRTSKGDENVVLNAIKQNGMVSIMGRKNEVLQELLKIDTGLGKNNNMFSVYRDTKKIPRAKGSERAIEGKDFIRVKKDGEEYFVSFENKNLNKTLYEGSNERTSGFLKYLGKFNRFRVKSLTTYNPAFVLVNFVRDGTAGMFSMLSELDTNPDIVTKDINKTKFLKNVYSNVLPNMRAFYQVEGKNKVDSELQKQIIDFKEAGGQTGYSAMENVEDIRKYIENLSNKKGIRGKASNVIKNVDGFVNNVNSAVENAIRFSAYQQLLKEGVDKETAAVVAKELTVNFNKAGTKTSTMNALYLFFNPSVQGTARLIKALGKKKLKVEDGEVVYDSEGNLMTDGYSAAQKFAIVLAGFSGLLAVVSRAIAGEDEDGQNNYDKVEDYVKERNLPFFYGSGAEDYVKMPLPYGFNLFANIGTAAVEMQANIADPNQGKTVGDGMGFLLSSFIGSFAPVNVQGSDKGIIESIVKTTTPSTFKPLVELAINEGYFGKIYKEPYGGRYTEPKSRMGKQSTGEVYKLMAKVMNDYTGGNESESGALDMHPETIKYMTEFFTGGTGKFFNRIIEQVEAGAQGRNVELSKLPFIRVVKGRENRYKDVSTFYNRLNNLDGKLSTAKREGERKGKRYGTVRSIERYFNDTKSKLSDITKQIKKVQKRPNSSSKWKTIESLYKKYDALVDKANKRYNDTLGRDF